MRHVLCLCPVIPQLDIRTRLIVLMHWRESRTTTNTGRLAKLVVPQSEIRLRGKPGATFDGSGLETPGRKTLFLFPSAEAATLDQEFLAKNPGPYTLVVPDGTWGQAKKFHRREPALSTLTPIKIPPGKPSEYRLRKESQPDHVSTFEAIARALGVIEGPAIQAELEKLFRIMIERILWSKGKLRRQECEFPIPDPAVEEFLIAGAKGRAGAKGSS